MPSVVGVAPGFILLPAREYEWELRKKVKIQIPVRGKISEILAKTDPDGKAKLPGEDDFLVFDSGVLQLWEIIRVLFAHVKYPALEDDECLNVVALEFIGDEMILYGEVIKSVS